MLQSVLVGLIVGMVVIDSSTASHEWKTFF
jgi:hypothetical protein